MLKTKEMAVAIIVAVAGGFSAQAAAADRVGPGWYLGADLGHAEIEPENQAAVSNEDLSDTAFAIHGGYRVNPYFAIETAYADLGDYSYRVDCPDVCIPEAFPRDISLSGIRSDLALVGSVPFGERFEAYAKVGIAHTEVESEVRSLNANLRSTDSSSDALYGVGLRLHFDAPWSLRLQWDRTPQVGEDQSDVDAWWLGVEYRFASRQR
ncbi:porin family protein [Lysobacter sp. D1-1-M9]|uniref:porin family protein n=1 Tax=Novilysobacter longmucuonensis TaxID=3098603 RepID=UPI002FCBDDCF